MYIDSILFPLQGPMSRGTQGNGESQASISTTLFPIVGKFPVSTSTPLTIFDARGTRAACYKPEKPING
jgi:hypothetical protein